MDVDQGSHQARQGLADRPNAYVYQNNGCDLGVVPPLEFDFAYSAIVFQHIPSREIIESYVGEVHRLLRPGGLFKFQVQGDASIETVTACSVGPGACSVSSWS